MATTQNTYTGDGSTTNYSFTFEYIKQADVKVTLAAAATTAFTFANATTLSFNTAPANGAAIRIYRDTDITNLNATFFPGSAIKAEDLNNNFTQTHFATQETDNEVTESNVIATTAKTTADTALTNSAAAITSANAAVTTANTADTNASAAVTTANAANATSTTAATDAASAVTTANTASTNASAAVTTANSAATDAATAITTANGAVTTANAATTAANNAQTDATSAISTANTAATNATTAVSTANTANTTAGTANTNATNAVNVANAAAADVANSVLYTTVVSKAALEALTPSEDSYYQVSNSAGLANATWGIYTLSNIPSSYSTMTQLSGITTRLSYTHSSKTFAYTSYLVNDPEARYLTRNLPVVTGDATNGSGQITLNCENNSHGVKIKGPPHSAAASYTLTLPDDTGTSGNVLKTDGSGTTSWGSADVVNDTTPQLGGGLDVNGYGIVSSGTNTDISINAARNLNITVDSNGTNGQLNVTGGPLICDSVGTNLISGTSPILRGENGANTNGSASLATWAYPGNILSRFELLSDRINMYFGSNSYYSIRPPSSFTTTTYYLPAADGSANQVLTTDGSGNMSWSSSDVVDDTTPQLGGDLDVNGHDIVSGGTNSDIDITAARHITLSVDNDVSGHDGEVQIIGGPLSCGSITDAGIILGSTPTLRGTSVSSLSTLGNFGNSILSRFELSSNRLDLYFGSNSAQHLSMSEGGDFQIMNDTSTQRGIAFFGGTTNNFLTIRPPSSFTTTTYYLPTADGSANSLLQTDGSGAMSWTATPTLKSVFETAQINSSGAATGTINLDVKSQAIVWDAANATANFVINVRGDGSTTLNSMMSTGQAVTSVYIVNYGSTAYYPTSVTVDGSAATVKWVGGAPSAAGTVNSITNYTLTIVKTGNAAFTVFASTTTYE